MQGLLHPDHSSSMSLIISLSVSAMPSFAKRLSIPEKQTKLFVSDEQIFRELRNEHRRIADAESPAQRGDYVLVETDDGHGVFSIRKGPLHELFHELGRNAIAPILRSTPFL